MESGKKLIKDVITAHRDVKHFPATNQAHFCWQLYNEFVLCQKLTDDEDKINAARGKAVSVCPAEWYEAWDEQRQNGNFIGVQATDAALAEEH